MAGYIGNKSQTLVDGYTQAAADAEFVNDPNSVITVSGSNVGIGTTSPTGKLSVLGDSSRRTTLHGDHIAIGLNTNGEGGWRTGYAFDDSNNNELGGVMAWGNGNSMSKMGFEVAGAERMAIDSSGLVGIGTGSPQYPIDMTPSGGLGSIGYRGTAAGATAYRVGQGIVGVTNGGFSVYDNDALVTRLAIDEGGRTYWQTTGNPLPSNGAGVLNMVVPVGYDGFNIKHDHTGNCFNIWRTANNGSVIHFYRGSSSQTTVGSIFLNDSSTSYNTSSDYRLKEDWQPVMDASSRVAQLNPVNFAWKFDGSRVDGFLAHEVQEVVPEAVTGTKDAMRTEEYEVSPAVLDDDGNVVTEAVMGEREVPDYQGIDQSKLVPLLTAALQEALTRIETLEADVAVLKGNA